MLAWRWWWQIIAKLLPFISVGPCKCRNRACFFSELPVPSWAVHGHRGVRSVHPVPEHPLSQGEVAAVTDPHAVAARRVPVALCSSLPTSSSLFAALSGARPARGGFPCQSFLLRATRGAAWGPHPAASGCAEPARLPVPTHPRCLWSKTARFQGPLAPSGRAARLWAHLAQGCRASVSPSPEVILCL